MKMMMILNPESCRQCPYFIDDRGSIRFKCTRFRRQIADEKNVGNGRPQWCIDKDVEVEDEK